MAMRKTILRDFLRAKINILAMDKIFFSGQKIFVWDNLVFFLDKNYCVHAEGRGNGCTISKKEKKNIREYKKKSC